MNDDLRGCASADLTPLPASFEADVRPERERFRSDVLTGLRASRKWLPSKYFYDARGSQLFEEICELPEYYLTRTEIALLERVAREISSHIPRGAALVEPGSGASTKTRLILDAAAHIRHYVPIDISESALVQAAEAIEKRYPALQVTPLVEDFTGLVELPEQVRNGPIVGFFPGSTIGNFTTPEAIALLRQARLAFGRDALFIVGADLVKDVHTLLRAYDDARGTTAAFNLNLLARINRELSGTFELASFRHRALWNAPKSRIEMHLVSTRDQIVLVDGEPFRFARGESIHTESSHKYLPERFAQLAWQAGWQIERMWSSVDPAFGIFMLSWRLS